MTMKALIVMIISLWMGMHCVRIGMKEVVRLSLENITLVMKDYDMGFVMFYEPESPRYQSYGPVLEGTAPVVADKAYNSSVLIGMMNVDKYPQMKEKYGLGQLPAIVWFNNVRNYSVEYSGETEMTKSFMEFIDSQIEFTEDNVKGVSLKDIPLIIKNEIEIREKNINITVVGNGKGNTNGNMIVICNQQPKTHMTKEFQMIVNSAWNAGIKRIYYTLDDSFKNKCNKHTSNSLDVLIYKLSEKNNVKEPQSELINLVPSDLTQEENYPSMIHMEHFAQYTSQKLEKVFIMYSKDSINLFTHQNEELISQGITTLTIAHKFELNSEEYATFLTGLLKIAKDNRKQMIIMIGNQRTRFSQQFVETYRLYETSLPILCVTTNGNPKIEKYRQALPSMTTAKEMLNEIKGFIAKLNHKQLTQYISSEDLPKPLVNSNGLYRLVGANFNEVLQQKKDVLVVYCSDLLPICREFMPRLEKMAMRLKKSKDLIVGIVNPYINEIENGGFNYLPGMILYPDVENKGEQGIEYKGKAMTREIIRFIKEKAKHPIEVSDADDKDIKDEYTKEIKRIDLNERGIGRKLFMQLSDPDLSQMYLMPDKETVRTEIEFIQHIIYLPKSDIKWEDL